MTQIPEPTARRYGKVFDEIAAEYDRCRPTYPDELNALVRTMSFYARLSPGQRQALEREHEAIYERLGRPIRASTVAALVTARRSTQGNSVTRRA